MNEHFQSNDMRSCETPDVSVLIVTYNHRMYIRKTLEGALMQQFGGRMEIVVADDCSTDGTGDEIKALQEEFPGKFRVLPREKNMGMASNTADAISQCRGKYIAICEGDDYWDHPEKIKRQYEVLEQDPELMFCNTAYRILNENGEFDPKGWAGDKTYSLYDFLQSNLACTCTVMFRREAMKLRVDIWKKSPFIDWLMWCELLENGKARYIPVDTAVYRRHAMNSEFYNPVPYEVKLSQILNILHELYPTQYRKLDKNKNKQNGRFSSLLNKMKSLFR